MGKKKKKKKLAVLTGWPYYRGTLKIRELRAVMTNAPEIHRAFIVLFSLLNNRNVDIPYGNWKNFLKFSSSTWNSFKINIK